MSDCEFKSGNLCELSSKNRVLLALLTIWGLTGINSVIFCAYEDIILLVCGIYGVYLMIKEFSVFQKRTEKD